MKSLRVRETGGFFAEGPWKIEGHSAEGMRSVARLPALRNQKSSVGRWRSVSETESFVERFSTALHKKTDVALDADAVTNCAPGTEPEFVIPNHRTPNPRQREDWPPAGGRQGPSIRYACRRCAAGLANPNHPSIPHHTIQLHSCREPPPLALGNFFRMVICCAEATTRIAIVPLSKT